MASTDGRKGTSARVRALLASEAFDSHCSTLLAVLAPHTKGNLSSNIVLHDKNLKEMTKNEAEEMIAAFLRLLRFEWQTYKDHIALAEKSSDQVPPSPTKNKISLQVLSEEETQKARSEFKNSSFMAPQIAHISSNHFPALTPTTSSTATSSSAWTGQPPLSIALAQAETKCSNRASSSAKGKGKGKLTHSSKGNVVSESDSRETSCAEDTPAQTPAQKKARREQQKKHEIAQAQQVLSSFTLSEGSKYEEFIAFLSPNSVQHNPNMELYNAAKLFSRYLSSFVCTDPLTEIRFLLQLLMTSLDSTLIPAISSKNRLLLTPKHVLSFAVAVLSGISAEEPIRRFYSSLGEPFIRSLLSEERSKFLSPKLREYLTHLLPKFAEVMIAPDDSTSRSFVIPHLEDGSVKLVQRELANLDRNRDLFKKLIHNFQNRQDWSNITFDRMMFQLFNDLYPSNYSIFANSFIKLLIEYCALPNSERLRSLKHGIELAKKINPAQGQVTTFRGSPQPTSVIELNPGSAPFRPQSTSTTSNEPTPTDYQKRYPSPVMSRYHTPCSYGKMSPGESSNDFNKASLAPQFTIPAAPMQPHAAYKETLTFYGFLRDKWNSSPLKSEFPNFEELFALFLSSCNNAGFLEIVEHKLNVLFSRLLSESSDLLAKHYPYVIAQLRVLGKFLALLQQIKLRSIQNEPKIKFTISPFKSSDLNLEGILPSLAHHDVAFVHISWICEVVRITFAADHQSAQVKLSSALADLSRLRVKYLQLTLESTSNDSMFFVLSELNSIAKYLPDVSGENPDLVPPKDVVLSRASISPLKYYINKIFVKYCASQLLNLFDRVDNASDRIPRVQPPVTKDSISHLREVFFSVNPEVARVCLTIASRIAMLSDREAQEFITKAVHDYFTSANDTELEETQKIVVEVTMSAFRPHFTTVLTPKVHDAISLMVTNEKSGTFDMAFDWTLKETVSLLEEKSASYLTEVITNEVRLIKRAKAPRDKVKVDISSPHLNIRKVDEVSKTESEPSALSKSGSQFFVVPLAEAKQTRIKAVETHLIRMNSELQKCNEQARIFLSQTLAKLSDEVEVEAEFTAYFSMLVDLKPKNALIIQILGTHIKDVEKRLSFEESETLMNESLPFRDHIIETLLFLLACGSGLDFSDLESHSTDRSYLVQVFFEALQELLRRDMASLVDLPYLLLSKNLTLVLSLSELSVPLTDFQFAFWINLARMFERLPYAAFQADLERTVEALLLHISTKVTKKKVVELTSLGLKFLVKAFSPLSRLAPKIDLTEFDKAPVLKVELQRLIASTYDAVFGEVIEI